MFFLMNNLLTDYLLYTSHNETATEKTKVEREGMVFELSEFMAYC